MRSVKNDIVGLPFAGRAAGIDQGRIFTVNGPSLAVRIGIGVVGIQYLKLVESHQPDAAVAASLIGSCRRIRRGPLNVKLRVSKRLLCVNVPRSWRNFKIAVADFPRSSLPVLTNPSGQILPVEEHHGIRRRLAGFAL